MPAPQALAANSPSLRSPLPPTPIAIRIGGFNPRRCSLRRPLLLQHPWQRHASSRQLQPVCIPRQIKVQHATIHHLGQEIRDTQYDMASWGRGNNVRWGDDILFLSALRDGTRERRRGGGGGGGGLTIRDPTRKTPAGLRRNSSANADSWPTWSSTLQDRRIRRYMAASESAESSECRSVSSPSSSAATEAAAGGGAGRGCSSMKMSTTSGIKPSE